MIACVAVDHYRSLRRLRIPLGGLTVVTGANGSGKSNVYRSLRLLADCARDGVVATLAREGGLQSAIWAGATTTKLDAPVALRFGVGCEEFSYSIELGLPTPDRTSEFNRDPQIKAEAVWAGPVLRPATLLVDRRGPVARVRGEGSRSMELIHDRLRSYDSVLSEVADYQRAPELIHVREFIGSWRFYDHFRTDADAQARRSTVGTRTPVLNDQGGDLAAAWQTIVEIGDVQDLYQTVDDAFPGGSVAVENADGIFHLRMTLPGLRRPLGAAEVSDGTLRYLLLAAALLSPRPPTLLVLNEPETSLHPDLLPALGNLIVRAATRTQIVVVSHSQSLIDAIRTNSNGESSLINLLRDNEGTKIEDQRLLDEPAWHFPER